MENKTVVPFRKATLRKRTLVNTFQPSASLGGRFSWDLDSKGYAGGVRILTSGTETTVTADPTAGADWPWNLFARIVLRDTSGGMLANLKGYSAMLLQRYTKPVMRANPNNVTDARAFSAAVASVAVNPIAFALDLDVECGTRDNVGLVPNQNAAFRYQLQIDFANAVDAGLFTTPANTSFALNVQPSYRYYTVPAPQRADGATQQSVPPFAGVVRQQWDETKQVPSAAENRYNLVPGRVVRNLILVARNSSGVRVNAITRFKLMYGDDTILFEASEQDQITEMCQLFDEAAPPTGVYVLPFDVDADGLPGADFRRDVLDTRRLSQFYLLLTTTSDADTIDIIHDELIVPASMSI